MNETTVIIIKNLADELYALHQSANQLKAELESKKSDADFWYTAWKEMRQKCIDAGLIENGSEDDPLGLLV